MYRYQHISMKENKDPSGTPTNFCIAIAFQSIRRYSEVSRLALGSASDSRPQGDLTVFSSIAAGRRRRQPVVAVFLRPVLIGVSEQR